MVRISSYIFLFVLSLTMLSSCGVSSFTKKKFLQLEKLSPRAEGIPDRQICELSVCQSQLNETPSCDTIKLINGSQIVADVMNAYGEVRYRECGSFKGKKTILSRREVETIIWDSKIQVKNENREVLVDEMKEVDALEYWKYGRERTMQGGVLLIAGVVVPSVMTPLAFEYSESALPLFWLMSCFGAGVMLVIGTYCVLKGAYKKNQVKHHLRKKY